MYKDNIPVTEARLSQSVEIRLLIPTQVNLGTLISYQLSPGATLGTIQKLTREQKRTNRRRYSLGRYSFEPYDIIPGPIVTTLTVEKVVLYTDKSPTVSMLNEALGNKQFTGQLGAGSSVNPAPNKIDGDLLSLFGFLGGNLLYQQDAVCIQEVVHQPNDTDEPTVTTYFDCWLNDNPIEYDVSDDKAKLIIQKATFTVGRVVSSITAEQAVAAAVKSILPSSINL